MFSPSSARWMSSRTNLTSIRSSFAFAIMPRKTRTKIGRGRVRNCANATSAVPRNSAGRNETISRARCGNRKDHRSVSEWRRQFIRPASKKPARLPFSIKMALLSYGAPRMRSAPAPTPPCLSLRPIRSLFPWIESGLSLATRNFPRRQTTADHG